MLANGWNHITKIFGFRGQYMYAVANDGNLYYYQITASGFTHPPKKVGEAWGGFSDCAIEDYGGDGIPSILAVTPQKLYGYNVNADGSLGGNFQYQNRAPSLTRWFNCRTTVVDSHPYLSAGNYYLRSERGYRERDENKPAFASGPVTFDEALLGEFLIFSGDAHRRFEVIPLSGPGPSMTIAIRAPNGKYVCSEPDGYATCNRTARSTWETFTLVGMPPDGAPTLATAKDASYRIMDYQGGHMQVFVEFVLGARVRFMPPTRSSPTTACGSSAETVDQALTGGSSRVS